jgi:hypothetical protein
MTPTPRLGIITIVASLGYLGFAILGWGGFAAFFSHAAALRRARAPSAPPPQSPIPPFRQARRRDVEFPRHQLQWFAPQQSAYRSQLPLRREALQ